LTPGDWQEVAVSHAFSIQLGKMLQTIPSTPNDLEVPYFKAKHVQWKNIDASNLPTMWASPSERSQYAVQEGDLLVSEGGDVGRSAILYEAPKGAIIQNALHRVRSNINDIRFLAYVLRLIHGAGWFDVLCNRTTIAHLTVEKLGALQVALPDPKIQKSIANYLDRKTTIIDALIEKKRRLLDLLAEDLAALINQTVTKGLNPDVPMRDSGIPWVGEVPAHWDVKRLKHLVIESVAGPYGSSLTKSMYTSEGFRVYGQQQVIPDDFSIGDYYISPDKFYAMSRYQIFPGDLLVSVMGTIGKVAVVPEEVEPGIINPRLVRYHPDTQIMDARYLQLVMLSSVCQEPLLEAAQGSTMDGLNMGILGELQIIVPPLVEQVQINNFVRSKIQNVGQILDHISNQLTRLQEYRQALITAAVTGQLDIEDAA
jgi:type I restriction enzyme S subunit